MINNLTKILIGTAVVAGVSAIIAVVSDKEEEITLIRKKDENGNIVIEPQTKEDKSILKRIKKFVKKKVIKFLAWVALHMEQIEAVSTVVGITTGVISMASALRDFQKGNDMQKQLDTIEKKLDNLTEAYTTTDALTKDWQYHNFKVINDNVKLLIKENAA